MTIVKGMLNSIRLKFLSIFFKDNERSNRVTKNIFLSFGVKGGSIAVGLLLVPLTIDYVSPIQYGIWLTVSSVINWLNFFDIGMGNGLRNKLAVALAHDDYSEAKKFVTVTYTVLGIIAILLLGLFLIVNPFLNWREFLNVPNSVNENIQTVILIVMCSFCLQFVVQLINVVLLAVHKTALSSLISFIGNVALLLVIYILKQFIKGDLNVLVTALTLVPMSTMIVASIYLFNTSLKKISPSFRHLDFRYAKGILNVGGIFFFINIGALLLLQTSNIIITKIISPSAVTEFNVAYKLFSVVIMVFTIIMTPYWSAFTEAFALKDFIWMKNTLNKIRKIWLLLTVAIVPILFICSGVLFKFWIGNKVHVSMSLRISMSLYVIGYTGMLLNCFFLNGIGKLRMQLYLYIVACCINIPLSIYWGRLYGTAGVTMSNVILFILMGVVLWIQSSKIINQTATGVWNQ